MEFVCIICGEIIETQRNNTNIKCIYCGSDNWISGEYNNNHSQGDFIEIDDRSFYISTLYIPHENNITMTLNCEYYDNREIRNKVEIENNKPYEPADYADLLSVGIASLSNGLEDLDKFKHIILNNGIKKNKNEHLKDNDNDECSFLREMLRIARANNKILSEQNENLTRKINGVDNNTVSNSITRFIPSYEEVLKLCPTASYENYKHFF